MTLSYFIEEHTQPRLFENVRGAAVMYNITSYIICTDQSEVLQDSPLWS